MRVPSGASTTDLPSFFIASTRGCMDLMALLASARSISTTPPISMTVPMRGIFLISFLPTPAMSRRTSWAIITTSALLWWLKTNTAGLCSHRCSSPLTLRFRPIRAPAVSANREKEKFCETRRDPVRAYIGRPAAKLVTRLAVAATERTNWPILGRPRLPKRATGQRLWLATLPSLELGLSTFGWPTRSSN